MHNNIKQYKPIRQEQIMQSDLEMIYNNRYKSTDETHESTREDSENRLSKIYVRSGKKNSNHKRNTSLEQREQLQNIRETNNEYMLKPHDLSSTMTSFGHTAYKLSLAKPI